VTAGYGSAAPERGREAVALFGVPAGGIAGQADIRALLEDAPALPPESVMVLVGAPASGKTTLRTRLLAAGSEPFPVVSPDDERAALRARDAAAGREPRDLQDYSLPAMRRSADRVAALLTAGTGYLADATNLRRRERVAHVRAAHEAGLSAIAVLLPALPVEVLRVRNAARSPERRVPEGILAKHAHRRGLLSRALLLEEGFDAVVELPALP
jgi:predicted kinase